MKVSSLKNSLIIILEKKDNINELKLELSDKKYHKKNLIIDINKISTNFLLSFFKTLVKSQKNKNKSLVFLTNNSNSMNTDFNCIPTHKEAIDFIDLEEIERDLNLI
jgi:hypothetical protein